MENSRNVLQWVDTNLLVTKASPSKTIGALFLIESAIFVVFLVCFALRFEEDLAPQQTIAIQTAVSNVFGITGSLPATIDDVVNFLVIAMGALPNCNSDRRTTDILSSQRMLGAAQLVQQRSAAVATVVNGVAFSCASPETYGVDRMQPFVDPLRSVKIGSSLLGKCPSALCDPSHRSPATWAYFDDSGIMLRLFNGSIFSNESFVVQSDLRSVFSSFVDKYTRFLSLQLVLLNAEGNSVSYYTANFEFPIGGGVFSWIKSNTVVARQDSAASAYTVVVWVYCSVFGLITVVRLTIIGIVRRSECQPCRSREQGFCATTCPACGKPVSLELDEATKCSYCGVMLQPPAHSCWRTQLDPTRVFAVGNVILIVVAILLENQARSSLQDQIFEFLSDEVVIGAPVLGVAGAIGQLTTIANVNAFNVLIAFMCLYRYLGRIPWISRFLKVISSGGALMVFFFLGFSAVFAGFMLSFHLLLGETMMPFSTFSGSFSATFQLLLGLLDWTTVDPSLSATTFTALYLFFCWVCILVLINVLISLVTDEYKRARKSREFDLEFESCRLLFQRRVVDETSHEKASEVAAELNIEDQTKEEIIMEVDTTLPLAESLRSNIDQLAEFDEMLGKGAKSIQNIAASIHKISQFVSAS